MKDQDLAGILQTQFEELYSTGETGGIQAPKRPRFFHASGIETIISILKGSPTPDDARLVARLERALREYHPGYAILDEALDRDINSVRFREISRSMSRTARDGISENILHSVISNFGCDNAALLRFYDQILAESGYPKQSPRIAYGTGKKGLLVIEAYLHAEGVLKNTLYRNYIQAHGSPTEKKLLPVSS